MVPRLGDDRDGDVRQHRHLQQLDEPIRHDRQRSDLFAEEESGQRCRHRGRPESSARTSWCWSCCREGRSRNPEVSHSRQSVMLQGHGRGPVSANSHAHMRSGLLIVLLTAALPWVATAQPATTQPVTAQAVANALVTVVPREQYAGTVVQQPPDPDVPSRYRATHPGRAGRSRQGVAGSPSRGQRHRAGGLAGTARRVAHHRPRPRHVCDHRGRRRARRCRPANADHRGDRTRGAGAGRGHRGPGTRRGLRPRQGVRCWPRCCSRSCWSSWAASRAG